MIWFHLVLLGVIIVTFCDALKHHNLPFRVVKIARFGSLAMMALTDDLTLPSTTDSKPSQSAPLRRMKKTHPKVDLSSFSVGQQFEGKVVSIMRFGVFVELSPGVNALVPRANISPSLFSQLSTVNNESNTNSLLIEITEISPDDGTITAKICGACRLREDVSSLKDMGIVGQQFNATIVSKHNFGIFAKVDQFEMDGLIPSFKIPRYYVSNLKVGQSITVKVDEVNADDGRLVFSIPPSFDQLEVFAKLPVDQWTVAEVKSVTNFGIFVRPVASDISGLIHRSRIPTDLLTELRRRISQEKSQSPCPENGSDYDTRSLQDLGNIFQIGDVVKVRVFGVDEAALRVDFTMMPDSDEDEGFIPEFQLQQFDSTPGIAHVQPIEYADESGEGDGNVFDAESTLVWWRGAPYRHSQPPDSPAHEYGANSVVDESRELRVGQWRRLFEDARRSEAVGSNSAALQNEIREIEEEIGDMASFTKDMEIDPMGISNRVIHDEGSRPNKPFALLSREDLSVLPTDWIANLPSLDRFERKAATKAKYLRDGKSKDEEELALLLAEIEKEISSLEDK